MGGLGVDGPRERKRHVADDRHHGISGTHDEVARDCQVVRAVEAEGVGVVVVDGVAVGEAVCERQAGAHGTEKDAMPRVRVELAVRRAERMDSAALAVNLDGVVAASVSALQFHCGAATALKRIVARQSDVGAASLEIQSKTAGRRFGDEVADIGRRNVGRNPEVCAGTKREADLVVVAGIGQAKRKPVFEDGGHRPVDAKIGVRILVEGRRGPRFIGRLDEKRGRAAKTTSSTGEPNKMSFDGRRVVELPVAGVDMVESPVRHG